MTKPTKWLCAQRRLRSAWASAQSDQSSLSAWRKLGSLATHWTHSEDTDQTGRMPRLIWVFTGRTVTLLVLSCRGSNLYSQTWKHSDTINNCYHHPNIWTVWSYHRVMHPKDANEMVNSVEPDQSAAWSRSTLFAQTCFSWYLEPLSWYLP